jgi:hypothetical protein
VHQQVKDRTSIMIASSIAKNPLRCENNEEKLNLVFQSHYSVNSAPLRVIRLAQDDLRINTDSMEWRMPLKNDIEIMATTKAQQKKARIP